MREMKRYRVTLVIETTVCKEDLLGAVDEGTAFQIEEVCGRKCKIESCSAVEEPKPTPA